MTQREIARIIARITLVGVWILGIAFVIAIVYFPLHWLGHHVNLDWNQVPDISPKQFMYGVLVGLLFIWVAIDNIQCTCKGCHCKKDEDEDDET